MKVVLHIGAPKTGTSAIQFFLNENRKRLQKHGFYYPEHNFDSNNVSGGHAEFGSMLQEGQLEEAAQKLEQWLQEAQARGCQLLLSSEAMYRYFDSVTSLFEGHELQVLAYYRHPLESLVSNHNQSIKRHYSTMTLSEFLTKQGIVNNPGINGQRFFDWKRALGDNSISIRPYFQSAFYQGRIEYDFLQRLGISGWSLRRFKLHKKKINTSYTAGALELKRLLNGLLDKDRSYENVTIDRALQKYSDAENNRSSNSSVQVVGSSVYDAITQLHEKPMARMKNELLEYCPNGFLEPQSVVPLENASQGDSLQQVLKVYKYLCNETPQLIKTFKARLAAELKDNDEAELPYALLKLAEIMGLPILEPEVVSLPGQGQKVKVPIPPSVVEVFTSKQSNPVDYLSEMAKWLADNREVPLASKLLKEAARRAKDPERKKQLTNLLDAYKKRLKKPKV
ncbi:hypothetical protein [Idiomarina piscisalsi]|uniref:Sulfotransferase family protein n=1 Tax=Idiomarina piscisalsi TaxID=1096243 RepID=A0A432YQZ6_9GAMM|nr:hypothetical protein [Idiomarina piscisalsi]RUO64095.1 hypothetical protein CWI73_09210 [Idiomarina piscisalsi]